MSTVDHEARHIWARTPTGLRCAYMARNARPDAAAVAKMGPGQRHRGREDRDDPAGPVGCERTRHRAYGLGDNRNAGRREALALVPFLERGRVLDDARQA